jgi:small-conductance mechanosensitive channel
MGLDDLVLGNPLRDWVTAVAVAMGVLLGFWFVVRIVLKRVAKFAHRTETDIDDLLAHVGAQTRLGLLTIPALYVGAYALTLPEGVSTWFRVAAVTASLAQTAVWGDAVLDFVLLDYREEHAEEDNERLTTVGAATFLLRLVLFGLIGVVAIDNLPGVEVTALIGSLGIGGIAVALAVQSILGDLFASLSITLDRPFALDDFIVVGDESGTVEHIGLKTTRIRSLSGEQVVLGNSDLLNSRIRNFGRMAERRVVFTLGVAPETPMARLAEIPSMLQDIIAAQSKTRFGRAHMVKFGDFTLEYEVVYFLQDPDYDLYMGTQHAISLGILQRFADEGIHIPYPTQVVYLAQKGTADVSEDDPNLDIGDELRQPPAAGEPL